MTVTATEITTRDALPEERDAIIALTLAAYAQYATVLPPEAWEDYAASIRSMFHTDTVSTRVIATHGTEIVGSALLMPPSALVRPGRVAQNYPEIRLIAVAPAARRRGVATALIDASINRARRDGYDTIGLHSTEYMADAIRLYLRLGFVSAPEHDITSPIGVHVYGFRRNLNPLTLPQLG